ncbi:activating transcription factor 7-interacting protein 1 [Uranotaenia lowii]|uniref:activating transcription factor 7-interacting protein 1 n=1 Tax=Uranotaenia lowii TaxID=190385 RepID=UPI002479462A|nr:activating transcription factor 7-interacting protein 1 [Uranotaenia lowii]XP_055603607.1 activating transcription factor 7-interacting protein 1 [Uranotaenia lowii]XP_055603608.1 activating transcription factor 7-interacting protein 1 [Uranotaenia lowii]XP_055603610.1 activating transcription factor 7-interacting protein 1 [Uranotaenia lowii]XP_055603611.1 activating transcription factor 7-interacting protein 1 [Uranotaenia lowii]
MMEVDQPITNGNGLATKLPEADAVQSIKQNGAVGTPQPQSATLAEEDVVMDIDETLVESSSVSTLAGKGLEDEENMERLMLSETDDNDEELLDNTISSGTELVQTISDTLIEDIIQLNKDSHRAEEEKQEEEQGKQEAANEVVTLDTLIDDELDEKLLLEGDDDDDAVEIGVEVDESELLAETLPSVELEKLMKEDEPVTVVDNSIVVKVPEADATIQDLTDSSTVVDDEAGLSILNTAAVDMTSVDETELDEPMEDEDAAQKDTPVLEDLMAEIENGESNPVELETDPAAPEQSEVLLEKEEHMVRSEAPSPDLEDLIKFSDTVVEVDEKETLPEPARVESETPAIVDLPEETRIESETPVIAELPEESVSNESFTAAEKSSCQPEASPEISDLIKFTSILEPQPSEPSEPEANPELPSEVESESSEAEKDNSEQVTENTKVRQSENESSETKDTLKDQPVIDAEPKESPKEDVQSEETPVEETDKAEETVIESVSKENVEKDCAAIESELSDLIRFSEPLKKSEEDEKSEASSETKTDKTDDDKLEPIEEKVEEKTDKSETVEEKAEEDTETKDSEEDAQTSKITCPQALQAADEEDLLEMMEEPDRAEQDDDQHEEDGDDHSSESGSAKPETAQGDGEDDDFDEEAESDYMAVDDEEASRNAEDAEEGTEAEQKDDEEADGEPPSKRRCSVDVRSPQEKVNESLMEAVEKEVSEKEVIAEETNEEVAPKDEKLAEKEESTSEKEATKEKKLEAMDVSEDTPDVAEPKSESEPELEEKSEGVPEASVEVAKKTSESVEKSETQEETKVTEESLKVAKTESEETVEEKSEEVTKEVSTEAAESSLTEATTKSSEEVPKTTEKSEKDDCVEIDGAESVEVNKEKIASSGEAPATEKAKAESKPEEPKKDTEEDTKKTKDTDAQDEILVIDDDDDVPEKKAEKKEAGVKRPCPSDEDANEDSAKKVRLSDKKEEDKPGKEPGKSALESIEPIKIDLDPEPKMLKELKPVRLDFLKKFKKPLEKMNRSDLEEFVLQKIVEGIAFKSTIADMRNQLEAHDTLLQGYRQKVHDLNKQFKDLEMVHERVVKDLEKRNQHFITPVKITRAVGLQVSQPRFGANNRQSGVNTNSPATNSPKTQTSRSQPATPTQTGPSPTKASPQNSIQVRKPQFSRTTAANKSNINQSAISRTGATVNSINRIIPSGTATTPVNKSITPLQSPVSTPQQQNSPAQNAQQQLPQATSANIVRKKPIQKFTPMRPPLSLTQQVQQQQQTRQMQEQLLRQQIQESQNPGSAPGSQPQSPLTQSPQGSPLTRTPEPASSPIGNASGRVPPIVVKKVGPPNAMQIVNRPTPSSIPPASTPQRPNQPTSTASSPAVDNSLIDLTDEDDGPKPSPVQQPTQVQANVVPKPPITLLNGQTHLQHQYGQQRQQQQQQQGNLPPLVVINQQRLVARPPLQQRPTAANSSTTAARPMLIQRPGVTNGLQRGMVPGQMQQQQQVFKARMANGQIVRAQLQQRTTITYRHPAPLPQAAPQAVNPGWKQAPPRPSIRINNIETGIVISWTMDDLSESHATIVSYQIYAYQETSAAPAVDMWRHVGDVKAMLLPMAVTLTQFQEGQRYHFAVRAVDEHQRIGQFSPPRTWNETAPGKA